MFLCPPQINQNTPVQQRPSIKMMS